MVRPRRLNTNRKQEKKTNRVTIRLDEETLMLYNKNFKGKEFSEQVRKWIRYYSAYQLTPEQKNQMVRERIGIENMNYERRKIKLQEAYNKEIRDLQRQMSTNEVSVIYNE